MAKYNRQSQLKVRTAEGSFVGDFLVSLQQSDLIDCRDVGTETAVHAQDFAVDDGGECEIVEYFSAVFPGRTDRHHNSGSQPQIVSKRAETTTIGRCELTMRSHCRIS